MTDTTTRNNPGAMPAPINVLREMDRFEAAMIRAFEYSPDRNTFREVEPHPEEAYQFSRDNDRFMGFCMAVAAGNCGRTIPAGTLLEIARETGLRSFLHGVNATDAREILARYQLAVDTHRESLPANPERQVSGWVYDATRKALDAVHAVCLEFGCPRDETVADWLRARLAAPAIVQPAATPINDREPPVVADLPHFPTMLRKMWSGGEVQRWIDDNIKPLVQERHFDFHCGSSAPTPADDRAAFDVALDALWRHQQNWDTGLPAEHAQGERIAMECACEAVREALEEARAASANETGAEGADIDALILAYGETCHLSASATAMNNARDKLKAAILSRSSAMAAEAVAIPAGYALVPIEPTEAMHAAAVRTIVHCTGNDDFPPRVWRAMLAAARQPAQADAREELTDDQRHTVECANAWLTDKGLPTYTVLRALLAAHPGQPAPRPDALVPCPICGGEAIGHTDMLERVTIAPKLRTEATNWQPIETAPKHTEVLVWRSDAGVFIAKLTTPDAVMTERELAEVDFPEDFEEWFCEAHGWQQGGQRPSHWMPIPEEPNTARAGGAV